jgi:endonuclease/exonuclease/phosphatase family metal-dependent hydrolase
MTALRLASYNVHKCVGPDGRRAPGRVLDVVNALGADLVALQETDRRFGERPATLSREMIESHSDFVPVEASVAGPSLGWHGNAVLLRRGILPSRIERLTLPGLEPRGALVVEASTPTGPVRMVAVHLGLRRRDRVLQLGAIRRHIAAASPMPTTILGDFNEWSLNRGLEVLDEYSVLAPGRSFHTLHPLGHLDRIALSSAVLMRDAGVHDTAIARRASDHLPVWADVALHPVPVAATTFMAARQSAAAGG